MTVTLDKSHELKGNGYLLGVGGENESEQLIINIAYDVLLDKWAYIEFEQNGAKITTERLTVTNGQIVYSIPNGLLVPGHTIVQVVFRDANGFVWKSFKRQFLVSDEINATNNYPQKYPDFITEAQKLLDEVSIESDKVDEVLATEEARKAAETERANNEATRLANETARETTEAERKTAETARKTAEAQRQANEVGRVDAETVRRTEFSGWAINFGNLNTYDKRIINVEEAIIGTICDYQEDNSTAYIKTIPPKALPYARLNKVGGVTYKADNSLIDTKVKSVGGYAIPEAIQLLDGYGLGINNACHNYIDFDNRKFVERVKKIDLGALSWYADQAAGEFYSETLTSDMFFNKYTTNLMITKDYTPKKTWVELHNNDKTIFVINERLYIHDNNYSNAADFKNSLKNCFLIYDLATPIETDISAYLTDNYIKVDGSIVFENDNAQAVPSEITYTIKR